MSQEFNNNVLDKVKQKGLHLYDHMSDFQNFNEELASKEKFSSLLTDKKIVAKNVNMFLILEKNLKENDEKLSWLVCQMWRFVISWCVKKIRNNTLKKYGLCPSHYLSVTGRIWECINYNA